MFNFVHGVFVIELFGGGMKQFGGFPDPQMFRQIRHEQHLGWVVFGLTVSRGISFATNYVGLGEFRRITPPQLMFQPYGRIGVLHVALKIMLDLAGHLRERAKFSAPAPKSPGLTTLNFRKNEH